MPSAAKVKSIQGLTSLDQIDVRSLAKSGDERDTFLSIYYAIHPATNSEDGRSFLDSRLKAIEKALPKDLKDAFLKTKEMIGPLLDGMPVKGERGRIIFASAPLKFLEAYRIGVGPEPLVVLDSSPFLLPLERLKGDYGNYGLLLLDSQEARLFLIGSGMVAEIDRAGIDLMNKHKKGGWSQMRYNRLRKGAIKSFFSELIDDLSGREDLQSVRGIIVAGPGEAKGQFLEMLPPGLKARVLGSIDLHMETPAGDLPKQSEEISRSLTLADSNALAERLKEAVLRGEPSAFGLLEVKNALLDGRVNHLLISEGFALPQMICMSCHHVHEGAEAGHMAETCPTCGGEIAALRLEELYELAERTGAEIALVKDDEFLESVGHVGALLRY